MKRRLQFVLYLNWALSDGAQMSPRQKVTEASEPSSLNSFKFQIQSSKFKVQIDPSNQLNFFISLLLYFIILHKYLSYIIITTHPTSLLYSYNFHDPRSACAKLILYFIIFSFMFAKLSLSFAIFISASAELIWKNKKSLDGSAILTYRPHRPPPPPRFWTPPWNRFFRCLRWFGAKKKNFFLVQNFFFWTWKNFFIFFFFAIFIFFSGSIMNANLTLYLPPSCSNLTA